ncbi:MAG TPA: hypothetical protein VEW65_08210, partial [Chryseolinea sp.]|nr:hypothetical protein [Chryseolinea sp.]
MKDYSLGEKNKLMGLQRLTAGRDILADIFRIWVLILIVFASSQAQTIVKSATTKKDTTIILISDLHVQLECTQALNDLYNFNFPRAEFQFKYLKAKFAWHPLPYFLMGLIEWWKIMPNTKNTSYDESFFAYMDSTIYVGENL